ncbi:adenylate/guanylate cyclase domain-containing response regulator [Mesorhizobium sp. B3-1-7]|uniref:adenylate/guanylate cyclase domain-containing response regulator n=1 Tax=Mesorhizobium sp. B3-1-7 TaxID=2589894 RepID=UPI00112ED3A5|nr:adenylate/guanylate cyclase domain-containing response regulator [Mesorhizobium sp. B3-1-7]TPI62447.1 adenylate/guanylate cyclase domain-containing response regulator [Mesorhizobium sp. B3-1-7]
MASIVIVDDENENLELLKLALGDENPDWVIHTTHNEKECVEYLSECNKNGKPVDLVLTDLVMDSEESGMNVLQLARKIDPLIMSILFTAKEKSLDRYAAFEYGAFDVVEKNIRGKAAVREINIKARAAIQYRKWSQKVNFLQKYFDPRVFAAIDADPKVLEMASRTVTIVFWDIRGFSRLCDSLKAHPTLISGFLREYFEIGAQVIFENDGVLDKFMGDGIMALFGFMDQPKADNKCGVNEAVKTAIELRDRFDKILAKWNEEWKLYVPDKIDIGLGCGIHTGDALVGIVGTSFRDQFTALGPQVNFSARIQGRAKSGQILLSQPAEARARDKFKFTEVDEMSDIKNIPGTFKIFALA